MRIAVVGGGISGLAAAYYLRRAHDVRLFEREPRAGGHAHTVMVNGLPVDTGFIVYNEITYPGFTSFLAELQVPTRASEMSFSVRCRAHGIEWSSRGWRGFLARRRNAARPAHWRMLVDMERFYRDAPRVLREDAAAATSLGEYLARRRFGTGFADHYLRPLAAAVWSTPFEAIDTMPLGLLVRFLSNHGMIGWGRRLKWRTVQGGSRAYVSRVEAALRGTLCAGEPVASVRREAGGARVHLASGTTFECDAVVFACHADEALRLLADASASERRALAPITYSTNRVVLHTDGSVLPRTTAMRAAWNYHGLDCGRSARGLSLTYDLNRLQGLPGPESYCISVNPREGEVRRDAIVRELSFSHPCYDAGLLAAQDALREQNGQAALYFAGAHLGYGFHEDGYQSGRRVAGLLGVAL